MKQMLPLTNPFDENSGCFGFNIFNNTSGKKVKKTWPNGSILLRHAIYVPIINVCISVFTVTEKNMLAPVVGSSLHCNDQN